MLLPLHLTLLVTAFFASLVGVALTIPSRRAAGSCAVFALSDLGFLELSPSRLWRS
jgi:hypothetical protein